MQKDIECFKNSGSSNWGNLATTKEIADAMQEAATLGEAKK